MTQESFVDYYEVLQVSPNADQETIERMYRFLAKRYHPDNTSTGSDEKFKLLSNAYRALCVPEKRAAYDARRAENQPFLLNLFDQDAEYGDIETDVRIQQGILYLLYRARRRDTQNSGMGAFELEKILTLPEKHLEFHIWYLKEKGWVRRTDGGQYEITASGVDAASKSDMSIRNNHLLLAESHG
jgi:curved DNA-binding protein CbpA